MTAGDLIRESGLPAHEAHRLLIHAGATRPEIVAGDPVAAGVAEAFTAAVAARRDGVPLQHLEGTVDFGPLTLRTDGRALIPRPETEYLWELAVRSVESPRVVVDLCTGSGNLALALRHAFPDADVYGTDLSRRALSLAEENATATGLDVVWCEGDLFEPLPPGLVGRVDLLVANPPYLATHELGALPPDVRDHDPHEALVAGPTGLEVIERIAGEAHRWLAPGGVVLVEIAPHQETVVRERFAGLDADVFPDLTGRPRILRARRRS